MKNIYSNIFKVNNKNISTAINCLKKKGLIGIPTETVYGLAGNAYSSKAVKKIYNLKKRPLRNPLIIHYYNLEQLKKDTELNKNFFKLYKKFSPGPITFVLNKKKKSQLSSIATAKSALEGLTKSVAADFAPTVRINAVAPTITDTELASKLLRNERMMENTIQRHPLKKYLEPSEVAAMACYLISDHAKAITGQIFSLDCGIVSIKT